MWCNNAIICTVLRINRRYFSSKKGSVEIFNAYMQDVNLKFFIILIYFTYVSISGPMYVQEISTSRFVELCFGVVVSEKPCYFTHTHTSYFLNTSLATSLHTTLYSHATPSCTENDLRLLCFVPVYQHALYFPVLFTMGNQEFSYIPLLRQGKSKTGIFQRLSKNA